MASINKEIEDILTSGVIANIDEANKLIKKGSIPRDQLRSLYDEVILKSFSIYTSPEKFLPDFAYKMLGTFELPASAEKFNLDNPYTLVQRNINRFVRNKDKEKILKLAKLFSEDSNNIVLDSVISALKEFQVDIAQSLIDQHNLINYLDPERKFNIPQEKRLKFNELKKVIFDVFSALKETGKFLNAVKLIDYQDNKLVNTIDLLIEAFEKGEYDLVKQIIIERNVFIDELSQPEFIQIKLEELRRVKQKHYRQQMNGKNYKTALLIAECDPDEGAENQNLIINTANKSYESQVAELIQKHSAESDRAVLITKINAINELLGKYDIDEELLQKHGINHFSLLFQGGFHKEAKVAYDHYMKAAAGGTDNPRWVELKSKINTLIEDKLVNLIHERNVSELKRLKADFDFKMTTESHVYDKVQLEMQLILDTSIKSNYSSKDYRDAYHIQKVINVRPKKETYDLAIQIFSEILRKAKVWLDDVKGKTVKYTIDQGKHFEEIFALGSAFKVKDYNQALLSAFTIYVKLAELEEANRLVQKNTKEFSRPKIREHGMHLLLSARENWKNNPATYGSFTRFGEKVFGKGFSTKNSPKSSEKDKTTQRSILYTILIAPIVFVLEALFNSLFKGRFGKKD